MTSVTTLLRSLHLDKNISLEENWEERDEEIKRLTKSFKRIENLWEERKKDCEDSMAVILPNEKENKELYTSSTSRDCLEEARTSLRNAFDQVVYPYFHRICDLNGDRQGSDAEKTKTDLYQGNLEAMRKSKRKMDTKIETYLYVQEKALDDKNKQKEKDRIEAERAAAAAEREKRVNDGERPDSRERWKEAANRPEKLSIRTPPADMRLWKLEFECWYEDSRYQNAPRKNQLVSLKKCLEKDVQDELGITDEWLQRKIAIFPQQSEEDKTDPDDCVWSQLDKIFKAHYPLTRLRFDLLDNEKRQGEDVHALHSRISGMIKDAKFDKMKPPQLEAMFMLYYMRATDHKLVDKVLEDTTNYGETVLPEDIKVKAQHMISMEQMKQAGEKRNGGIFDRLEKMQSRDNRGKQPQKGRANSTASGSRSNSSGGQQRKELPSNWRNMDPDEKKTAFLNAGVCMRCGANHNGNACEHKNTKCGTCGGNGHTTAACFTGPPENGDQASRAREKKRAKKRNRERSRTASRPAPAQPGPSDDSN